MNDMKKVKVRFAPSPTGNLHIGGARTALFNWLFAKKNNGDFILRIDDTDNDRNSDDSIHSIIDDLKWLGLTWTNPDLIKASDRIDLYKNYALDLVSKGLAYYDTSDLGTCIKIKLSKDNDITFFDDIKGKVTFSKDLVDDFVLMKSDGTPSYNFATVIDDHLMDITHVYRADEHLNNTPRQILIYRAFNWDIPKFGHMALIMGKDGKKMSKRDGSTTIKDFINSGFIADAVINYISHLGWGHPKAKDIYSMNDLIDLFSFKRVKSDSAIFDYDKFIWINGQYIKAMDHDTLKKTLNIMINPKIVDNFIDSFRKDWMTLVDYKKDLKLVLDSDIDLSKDSLDFLKANKTIVVLYDTFINYHTDDYLSFDDFINNLKLSNFPVKNIMWSLRSLMIGSCHGMAVPLLGKLIHRDILINRLNRFKKMIID